MGWASPERVHFGKEKNQSAHFSTFGHLVAHNDRVGGWWHNWPLVYSMSLRAGADRIQICHWNSASIIQSCLVSTQKVFMYGYIEMHLGDRPTKWMCLRKQKLLCESQWFPIVLKSFITQSMSHAGFLFFIFIFPTNEKFDPSFPLTDPRGVAYY